MDIILIENRLMGYIIRFEENFKNDTFQRILMLDW